MSYTKQSIQETLDRLGALGDSVSDAITALEEYIEALDDKETDPDDLGLAEQNVEESLDDVEGYGVEFPHLEKKGAK